jgi:hypothetical protein
MYGKNYTYLSGRTRKKAGEFFSERFTLVERVVTEESGGLSTTRSV